MYARYVKAEYFPRILNMYLVRKEIMASFVQWIGYIKAFPGQKEASEVN